jgi:hypothetical protein
MKDKLETVQNLLAKPIDEINELYGSIFVIYCNDRLEFEAFENTFDKY